MRVGILAHLLSFAPGYRQAGVSRYIEFLLADLPRVAPDEEFHVFAGPDAAHGRDQLPRELRWSLSRLPTERPPVRILWEQVAGPVALGRQRIDVAHAPVNVAPLLTRVPTVVTVHDLAFRIYPEQYPAAKRRYLDAMTRRSVRRAARVIAVSENTRQDVIRLYGVPPERVVVVPNGVPSDLAPVDDRAALQALRDRHGLPEEFILFVGTLQPRKNLVGLLRAFGRLRDRVQAPLVVVGAPGWQYQPIFDEAQALGVADRVVFAGYAAPEELRLWYSAATVFIYPSLYEGFGLPVLEAMACGAPVITSSTSSLPEVVGDAALLVDPTDLDAIAGSLERVLREPQLRRTLRQRGLARAREFGWERTARETVAVYRAVAGVGRAELRLRTHEERS